MTKQSVLSTVVLVAVALALGLLLGLALTPAPKVQVVKEQVLVPQQCPVLEPVVCPEVEQVVCSDLVVDEEAFNDWEQDQSVKLLVESELKDEDFLEDLFVVLNDLEDGQVEDLDDLLSLEVKDLEIDWEDREDGQAEVEVELKARFLVDGDEDDHSRRLVAVFVLNDEDLEEFESYSVSDLA